MLSPAIVIGLNIYKQLLFRLSLAGKVLVMDQLVLQGMKERLSNCIVPAVTLPAHALDAAMSFKLSTKFTTGILNTSIAVKYQPRPD